MVYMTIRSTRFDLSRILRSDVPVIQWRLGGKRTIKKGPEAFCLWAFFLTVCRYDGCVQLAYSTHFTMTCGAYSLMPLKPYLLRQ